MMQVEQKRRKRRELWKKSGQRFRTALSALLMLALLSGCSLMSSGNAPLQAPLIRPVEEKVDTVEATTGTIETFLRGNATFVSNHIANLSYKDMSGRLKAIHVKNGDAVEAGQLLAELDTEDIAHQIDMQKLNVERASLGYMQAVRAEADELTVLSRSGSLEREKTSLLHLEQQLAQTKLVAPFDGTITFLASVKAGDNIHAYQTIAAVSDPASLKLVHTATNPGDLIAVEIGMEVAVAYKGGSYTGKVLQAPSAVPTRTDPAKTAHNATRIIIGLEQMPSEAQIGGSAEILMTLQRREEAVLLPRNAIRNYMGRNYVQVIEGERRKEVDVEIGLISGGTMEIAEGVAAGQKVVLGN